MMAQLPRNYTNILRFLKQKIPYLLPHEQEAQARFYAYQTSLHAGAKVTTEFVVPEYRDNATYCYGKSFVIPPAECEVPDNYPFNGRWRVKQREGFSFRYRGDEIITYPSFKTKQSPPRFFVQGLFQLSGVRPFALYDVSSVNATKALSRYFKARPNETNLFIRQLSLIPYLGQESLALCGSSMTECPVEYGLSGKVVKSRFGTEYKLKSRNFLPYIRVLEHYCNTIKDITFWLWLWNYLFSPDHGLFSPVISGALNVVAMLYTPWYYLFDRFEFIGYTIQLPTPKRVLYENWYKDDYQWPRMNGAPFSWTSKVKKEFGKIGKVPRLYGSGEAACLLDRVCPDILKKLFKNRVLLSQFWTGLDLEVWFTFSEAQDPEISKDMYRSILKPRIHNGIEIICFSDDVIGVAYRNGTVTLFEGDISSCDSSNGPAVFGFMYRMIQSLNPYQADNFVKQCANPTKLENPANPEEFVVLQPEFFFEYSGCLLTTVLNNVAVLLITMGVCELLHENPVRLENDVIELFTKAAELNGWVVTAFTSNVYEKVTFLKRFYDGSESVTALGAILRSLGVFPSGLEASKLGVTTTEFRQMTEEQKLVKSLRVRLDGLVHEPHHLILNALRVRAGLQPVEETVPLESLQRRYGHDDYEWYNLVDVLETIQVGDNVHNSLLASIYKMDYGLI